MIHRLTVQFLAKGSYAVEVIIHPSDCAAAKSNSFVGLCFQPCMNSQLAGTSKNLECQRFSILITLNCTDFWAFKCPCRTVGFQMAHTFEASPQRPLIFIYFFTSTVNGSYLRLASKVTEPNHFVGWSSLDEKYWSQCLDHACSAWSLGMTQIPGRDLLDESWFVLPPVLKVTNCGGAALGTPVTVVQGGSPLQAFGAERCWKSVQNW